MMDVKKWKKKLRVSPNIDSLVRGTNEEIDVDKGVIQAFNLITKGKEDLAIVHPEDSLRDVIRAMLESPKTLSAYVVDEDGVLIGVISVWDILQATVAHDPDTINSGSPSILFDRDFIERYAFSEKAEDLMREPVCVDLTHTLRRAYRLMVEHGLTEIPVVDNQGRIIGDLSMLELLESAWNLDGRKNNKKRHNIRLPTGDDQ
uniref:CBS domain-containing protein n=1 Tax=uncultured euryarchaeote Alv-FOS5 TaxID=337891 RepID=Q3SBA0_9EURY|nr:hypothetical protein [uncultured euryarchaeote Alv-FOS5]